MKERLERLIQIRPGEFLVVGWAWIFFFSVLTAYYVLRPIRDDMGVAGGVQNLAWLFSGTLTGVAIANPVYGYLAGRMTRSRLVSTTYRFFAVNLLLFFAVLHLVPREHLVWAGRIFFVWVAIFTMIANSVFWTVMADTFSTAQGKRLFGFIGVGGTIGAITGASITSGLVGVIGAPNLLLVSAALLEVSGFAARRVFQTAVRDDDDPVEDVDRGGMGGKAWDGFIRTFSDSYLAGIALHVTLFTFLTTFLYFQQATIVDASFTNRVERTQFFANIDLLVNVLALVTQSFATGHLVRLFGLSTALAFLPALSVLGFTVLGTTPTVFVLMTFVVLRRSGEFAVGKPSREVLFTAARRQDRYKAKNFIDTFVYRAGDQLSAWFYAALVAAGLTVAGTSTVAVVLALISIALACWLGWRQPRESARQHEESRAAHAGSSSSDRELNAPA